MLNSVFDTKNEVNETAKGPNSINAYLELLAEKKTLQSALKDYKTANSIIRKFLYTAGISSKYCGYARARSLTEFGFCRYFRISLNDDSFPKTLLEAATYQGLTRRADSVYWFKKGDIKSRIKLLKQCIKTIDLKLNEIKNGKF